MSKENNNNQYLLFLVGGDLYAIEALKTSEIVEYSHVTKVPLMPSFVKGVTNIRGNIVPVVDMLNRIGIGETSIGEKTSIVVINHLDDGDITQMGILIDEVYEVDYIQPENTKPKPDFGAKFDKKFIDKMGKYEGNYITILDTQALLNIEELSKN
ncbi:MAG: chemotaxis protein CheW [Campylobacterota bacterium]|nr:chemotaxis protein CheW [Campylobacterota bacterium]